MIMVMTRSTERRLFLRSSKKGQAAVEYLVVAAMLIGAVAIMAVLLYTLRESEGRVLDLVGSNCP